jgi:hypothetical protein
MLNDHCQQLTSGSLEACDPSRASHCSRRMVLVQPLVLLQAVPLFTGVGGKIDSVFSRINYRIQFFRTISHQICYNDQGGTNNETGDSCSMNILFDCGASPRCDGNIDRCENNCNGVCIYPTNPPQL